MSAPSDPRFRWDLGGLVQGWLRMAPAVLVTWAIAALPPGPGVREAFVAAIASVFVVVAAARSRGLHPDRSVLRLGLERLVAHSINVLMFLLILSLAAGLGGTLGSMTAVALGVPEALGSTVTSALAVLPLLYWFWPVPVLAGTAPAETGRPSTRSWLWRGPGYTSARRLLASFGSGHRTAVIIGVAYLWTGLVVAAGQYRGPDPFPMVAELLSYAVFFPLWTWLAVTETHRLIQTVLDGLAAGDGPVDGSRPSPGGPEHPPEGTDAGPGS